MPLFKKKSASDQQTVERQALLDFLGLALIARLPWGKNPV